MAKLLLLESKDILPLASRYKITMNKDVLE